MKKAPEAFRTISEVSDLLETPAHVLRFWESKFYQIRPVKRAGGRRYYRPDDVALINGIKLLLQEQGLTIRGAQRVLQENGVRHVIALGADLQTLSDEIPGLIETTDAAQMPPVFARPESVEQPDMASARLDPIPAPPSAEGAQPGLRAVPFEPDHPRMDADATSPGLPGPETAPAPASDTTADQSEAETIPARLPHLLRQMPRPLLEPARDRLAAMARRIDSLLDRMSEASGAGRW